jgi:hypothetical protein
MSDEFITKFSRFADEIGEYLAKNLIIGEVVVEEKSDGSYVSNWDLNIQNFGRFCRRAYMTIVWELDFYSRPILDENKKKIWELLICDRQRQKEWVKELTDMLNG